MKEFLLGCNYWASNAGTEMWRNWDEDAIRNDFEILSRNGVKHLRVFPVWRDFQPVSPLFDSCVKIREYRVHEDKIPENKYYLDEAMLGKFEKSDEKLLSTFTQQNLTSNGIKLIRKLYAIQLTK